MSAVFVGFVDDTGRFRPDYPQQFQAWLQWLKGEEVELELRKRRSKRSERQNRGFHAMITPWALGEGHQVDDLKRELLEAVFGTHDVTSLVTGEVLQVLNKPHTSQLTTAEMSELIERTLEIAAGCGVLLEAPSEYRERQEVRSR